MKICIKLVVFFSIFNYCPHLDAMKKSNSGSELDDFVVIMVEPAKDKNSSASISAPIPANVTTSSPRHAQSTEMQSLATAPSSQTPAAHTINHSLSPQNNLSSNAPSLPSTEASMCRVVAASLSAKSSASPSSPHNVNQPDTTHNPAPVENLTTSRDSSTTSKQPILATAPMQLPHINAQLASAPISSSHSLVVTLRSSKHGSTQLENNNVQHYQLQRRILRDDYDKKTPSFWTRINCLNSCSCCKACVLWSKKKAHITNENITL